MVRVGMFSKESKIKLCFKLTSTSFTCIFNTLHSIDTRIDQTKLADVDPRSTLSYATKQPKRYHTA